MTTEQQMKQWISDIAGAEVTLAPYMLASYRATWEAMGQRHIFTFGKRLQNLDEPAFKIRAAQLIAEGQHSYFTEAEVT
jgi:hypothetical protein